MAGLVKLWQIRLEKFLLGFRVKSGKEAVRGHVWGEVEGVDTTFK